MPFPSFKLIPVTVFQMNEGSVVVEADGVNCRQNVNNVQKYLLREADVVATAAPSDRYKIWRQQPHS